MKKIISLFLLAAMLFGFTACESNPEDTTETTNSTTEATEPTTVAATQPQTTEEPTTEAEIPEHILNFINTLKEIAKENQLTFCLLYTSRCV